jgi:hypothetical protein
MQSTFVRPVGSNPPARHLLNLEEALDKKNKEFVNQFESLFTVIKTNALANRRTSVRFEETGTEFEFSSVKAFLDHIIAMLFTMLDTVFQELNEILPGDSDPSQIQSLEKMAAFEELNEMEEYIRLLMQQIKHLYTKEGLVAPNVDVNVTVEEDDDDDEDWEDDDNDK